MNIELRDRMIATFFGFTEEQVRTHLDEAYERSDGSWLLWFRSSANDDPTLAYKLNGSLSLEIPREIGYRWSEKGG